MDSIFVLSSQPSGDALEGKRPVAPHLGGRSRATSTWRAADQPCFAAHQARGASPALREFEIEVLRDRESTLEPELMRKRQALFAGFGEEIRAPYARGMTVRNIPGHLEEPYGVDVSPLLISSATSAVHEDVLPWQSRPSITPLEAALGPW